MWRVVLYLGNMYVSILTTSAIKISMQAGDPTNIMQLIWGAFDKGIKQQAHTGTPEGGWENRKELLQLKPKGLAGMELHSLHFPLNEEPKAYLFKEFPWIYNTKLKTTLKRQA